MSMRALFVAIACCVTLEPPALATGPGMPETVTVPAGRLSLHALLWRPSGTGPFPAMLFTHDGGASADLGEAATLGPVFAGHGYAFLFLYRHGSGLSANQGTAPDALLRRELQAHGPEARNRLELQLLDEHAKDVRAGLAFLRALPDVDAHRVAIAGHAFGGMLALLVAEDDPRLRAVVDFAGGADSWAASEVLRARLMAAVDKVTPPVFFIQTDNDASIAPSEALATERLSVDKPRRIEIYPGVGTTRAQALDFVYLGVAVWERDVFAFLDEHMRN